ncbi:dethiobiotin synthase [Saccharopolyspora rhizosphaerae]|uniref:ATP-dependent dethiobiotin synthetase BioD n=1 Tax=Saccharopolyspora rhizosphaerae TaxID=2492662 RepID=A0A3R8P542_9PSEU|nr:dethiobiotin synthase [Saccharopolyspora rhizosphaerae]RRO16720.1 dethiobiotin synthase [Saccharopolyspora rhizosphaerae]
MIVFVTGTDTGVGKTVATAALAVHFGPDVMVVKPAQTGADEPDVEVARRLAGCAVAQFSHLADPLAPDTAARLRNLAVPSVGEHAARIRELACHHDVVIVEGSGGALVRLDTAGGTLPDLATDLARDHEVRVHVVTRLGLGTLNHTALTVEALRARGLEPAGLLLGSAPDNPDLAERCNLTELPRLTGVPVLAALPDGAGTLKPTQFRTQAPTWFEPHTTTSGT